MSSSKAEEFEFPSLVGRRVRLRPVGQAPDDYPYLWQLLATGELLYRWRYRGIPPTREDFIGSLHQNTLIHFIIEQVTKSKPDGRDIRVGYAVAYFADFRNGVIHFGLAVDAASAHTGIGAEAGILAIDYLFKTFPFRKVYLESLEDDYRQFGESPWFARVAKLEGRLHERFWIGGRYVDEF